MENQPQLILYKMIRREYIMIQKIIQLTVNTFGILQYVPTMYKALVQKIPNLPGPENNTILITIPR
jgi:hypothetical protein